MKLFQSLAVFTLILFAVSCQKSLDLVPLEEEAIVENENLVATSRNATTVSQGYNMRWLDTPDFSTTNVLSLINNLQPDVFRYPGGTVAHKWNWRTGRLANGGNSTNTTHYISDVKVLADATGADATFVLDVVHSSLADQIEMLQAANVPVKYIELGNELYANEYIDVFPTGKEYADLVNEWVPALRAAFPQAKIGAVMLGRFVWKKNPRNHYWNQEVSNNITEPVDAYIYHIYISNTINGGRGESVQERLKRLDRVFIRKSGKETWITEYGDKGQDYTKAFELAEELVKAPYNSTLLVNHCIIAKSGNFTKIEQSPYNENEYGYTAEGQAFLEKYNPNFLIFLTLVLRQILWFLR